MRRLCARSTTTTTTTSRSVLTLPSNAIRGGRGRGRVRDGIPIPPLHLHLHHHHQQISGLIHHISTAAAKMTRPPRRAFHPVGQSQFQTQIQNQNEDKIKENVEEKDVQNSEKKPPTTHLQGIIFDMDGTLCLPQNHMFTEMRTALSIPPSTDILTHISTLPTPHLRASAHTTIEAIERRAMRDQQPQEGLVTLLEFLDGNALRKGICTRNFDLPVSHFLGTHVPGHVRGFEPVVTRGFRPPKPSPEGIWWIAREWGVLRGRGGGGVGGGGDDGVEEEGGKQRELPLIMVGDSVDDMAAGRDAGCVTVLLRSEGKEELEEDERTDVVIGRLDELVGLLEAGLETR